MIAYTRRPGDSQAVYLPGPNGGAWECDLGAPSWELVEELPGGPYDTTSERVPDGVDAVIEGPPPPPDGGWRIGDEVVVREICYAGPQWIYGRYRLVPGCRPGYRFGPVGRIAYGQRMY